jgi:Flp pilus assembly protein TadG
MAPFSLLRRWRRPASRQGLWAHRRGSAALEFGAIGIAGLMLLLLIFETSLQVATSVMLEHGAREAARYGATGQASGTAAQQAATIATLVVTSSGNFLQAGNLTITTTSYASLGTLGTGGTSGLGASSTPVQYTLVYRQYFFSAAAILTTTLGVGYIDHRSVIVVQNEPYPS